MSFNYLQSEIKVMSRCLSAPDDTSPHHCLQNHHQYCTILSWIQALDTKGPVANLVKGIVKYMPSPFYPASAVLFQLHGGMVSHMQVSATLPSTVHNTKYLDPYLRNHISFSCLFLKQWCRDVASGADRHLDITLISVAGSWSSSLFPYFLEKHLTIPTSPFFIY